MTKYNSFSGVDISEVFNKKAIKDLQTIEYKVRQIRCFSVDMSTGKVIHESNCECFGLCECGAEKCNTTHSNWCPKY